MKTLILSCSTGEGHNSAARAVQEALTDRNIPCELVDALRFAGEKPSSRVTSSFNSIAVHAPAVFGLAYKAGDLYSSTKLTSPVYLANSMYSENLQEYIKSQDFQCVVCTHLFPMEALTYLKRNSSFSVPCYGVLTDYTCIPFLEETDLDAYFLPHTSVLEECVHAGMPNEKLFVTGLPVAKKFTAPSDRLTARRKLHIPENKKMYLVMSGGIGCGHVQKLCGELLRSQSEDGCTYILTGHNDRLKEELTHQFEGDPRACIIPFTQNVHLYMSAADVLLSKPGGISSTEAACVRVPLVHTLAIPGCETKNAAFFQQLGMSLFAEHTKKAVQSANMLANDTSMAEKMRTMQRKGIKRDGAAAIADFVINGPENAKKGE